jgi:hypothetical protein
VNCGVASLHRPISTSASQHPGPSSASGSVGRHIFLWSVMCSMLASKSCSMRWSLWSHWPPPAPDLPGITFFGPGEHRLPAGTLSLASHTMVYLAAGSWVRGSFYSDDASFGYPQ